MIWVAFYRHRRMRRGSRGWSLINLLADSTIPHRKRPIKDSYKMSAKEVRVRMTQFAERVSFGRGMVLAAAGGMALSVVCAFGQAPAAKAVVKVPAFDVMSVKPNKSGDHGVDLELTPDGFMATNVTVDFLLTQGSGLNADQIFGEPGWMKTETFDVEAKVAGPDVAALRDVTFEQRRSMFLQVLDGRFQLKVHHETRELSVYQLVIAKGGPKVKESKPATSGEGGDGPSIRVMRGNISAQGASLQNLVTILSRQLHRTILDKTGLTGNYDLSLVWTPDDAVGGDGPRPGGAPASTEESGPSIFSALQEQLGLKLEATKGPSDVIVVDSVVKPAEN